MEEKLINELKIICPFCNAPYTTEMKTQLSVSSGCDTCGPEGEASIEIYCSNCKKLVYKKGFTY